MADGPRATHNAHLPMAAPSPATLSLLRRLLIVAALLAPLAVDPFAADTQLFKKLLVSLLGVMALATEAAETLLRPRTVAPSTWPERFLALLAGWSALSVFWATNAPYAMTRALILLGVLGITRSLRELATDPAWARRVVRVVLGVGALAVLVDTAAILNVEGTLGATSAKFASWLFVHNNMAASYVTLLAPLTFAAALSCRPFWPRAVPALVLLGGLLAYLSLLSSRAGQLGAILGMVIVGVLFASRSRITSAERPSRRTRVGLIAVVVILGVLPFSDGARGVAKDVYQRAVVFAGIDDGVHRMLMWRKTMEMAFDQPALGVGAGNFAVVFPSYERLTTVVAHAHNDLLQVLAELGLVGLLLHLGLLTSAAWMLVRGLVSAPDRERFGLAAGLLASLAVFTLAGLFEVPFTLGATMATLATLLGLGGATLPASRPLRPPWAGRVPVAVALLFLAAPAAWSIARRLPGSWYLMSARQQLDAGDLDGAFQTYAHVDSLRTGSHVPAMQMGAILRRQGEPALALEQLRAARQLWPHGVDVLSAEAYVLHDLGRPDEALEVLEVAAVLSPEDMSLRYRLISALREARRLPEAISRLEHEVSTDRAVAVDAVFALARLYQEQAAERGGFAGTPELPREARESLVAARHFYALALARSAEEGQVDVFKAAHEQFVHLTDVLQHLSGAPDVWWHEVYTPWLLKKGSPDIPVPFHYTRWMSGDPVEIYPGWDKPDLPPVPVGAED